MRPLSLVIGLVSLAAVALAPAPATACSPDTCIRAAFAPRDGGVVPANGALAFRPSGDHYDGNPPDGFSLVRVEDGAPVEVEVVEDPRVSRSYVVRFATEPAPGVYRATFPNRGCYDEFRQPDHEITFTVIPAAERPTWAGQPRAAASGRETISVFTSSGSCFADIDAAVARVGHVPGCDAWPWRDVARYSLGLDGFREGARAFYGEPAAWRLHAACGEIEEGADHGLGEGTHAATVSLHLPGDAAAIGASPVQVTLDCDARGGDQPSEAPICAEGPAVVPIDDERPDDWLPETGRSGADAGGCATGGGGRSAAALPLLALALLLARKRR